MSFKLGDAEYTYDVGVPDAQGGALPAGSSGTPPVSTEDTTGKDLSKPTKLTLSQFLSDLTTGKQGSAHRPNHYPIERNGAYPPETTTEVEGYPSQITDATNASRFTQRRNDDGLQTLSDDVKPLVDAGFRKGARSDAKLNGNTLLRDPSGVVDAYTSNVLRHNRFTSTTYDLDRTVLPTLGLDGLPRPMRYHGGKLEFAGNLTSNATELSPGRLATVGASLSARASRELTSGEPGNDPNGRASTVAALIPSAAQLGVVRVTDSMLRARDVISDLTKEESNESLNVVDASWGTLNNIADPYSGIAAVGMYALALSLGAGIVLLINGLSTLLTSGKPPPRAASKDTLGRYALGRYTLEPRGDPNMTPPIPLDIGAFFGVRGTMYPFMSALKVGTNAFFGIDDGTVSSVAKSALKGALGSPGFYSVVARTILRSGILLVDELKAIGGTPIDVVKQVIGLVDVIRSSRLIAALNVFAQLGDQILSHDEKILDTQVGGTTRTSTMDSFSDDITAAVSKSRLRDSLKLAWASNRTPTLYLLPKGLDGAMLRGGNLGGFRSGLDELEDKSLTEHYALTADEQKTGGPRIPIEDSMAMERQLDAEYVPFYFKDLRTNEIISFHAFLASLSDDYTTSWEETEGFGRVDPVSSYKNTRRKIGLSFYVASTSPADFDEMWVKINKLVTLVYPQYSAGKTLTTSPAGDYRFTQPFSQLISASPIIRIRLGDLLRSNYTRFALARLFGLGAPGMRLDGTDIVSRDRPGNYASKLAAAKRDPRYTFRLKPGAYSQSDASIDASLLSGGPKQAPVLDLSALSEFFVANYVMDHPSGDGRIIVKVSIPDSLFQQFPKIYASVAAQHDDPDRKIMRYAGGSYIVPAAALDPTEETRAKILSELDPGGNSDEGPQKLADFLSPDSNAIVRSFRSAGGKGLAGKIDSMNFDWYDKVTWDTAPGRTAPIMCKVTIAFSPIHDISPGLDHMGANRAPIYPVGTFMRGGDDVTEGKTS